MTHLARSLAPLPRRFAQHGSNFRAALLVAALSLFAPATVLADPSLGDRLELVRVVSGDEALASHAARALADARTARASGDEARAQRLDDLALALVRTLEAHARRAELEAQVAEARRRLTELEARRDAAQHAADAEARDRARVEASIAPSAGTSATTSSSTPDSTSSSTTASDAPEAP